MKSAFEIVEAVDKFSNGKLKEKNTLEFLLKIAIENDMLNLVDEMAFQSKFLWRVFSFFQSGRKFNEVNDDEFKSRILNQINESVEKIKTMLLSLIEKCSELERENFVGKFLRMDAESFGNFMNLVHDFYWLKNWKIDNEV